jgi:glucosamine-6-phosphate deaminase
MKSKQILLVAYGENKAQAVADMIEGPVTTDVPASVLQNHDDVIVIIDEKAASKIKNRNLITTIA